MARMIAVTFNTTDGKSFRFEDTDADDAYRQYLDPKYKVIFILGEIGIYLVKRHIASVVIGD